MKPERLVYVKKFVQKGQVWAYQELFDEIERLQTPLPEKWEKRLEEIESNLPRMKDAAVEKDTGNMLAFALVTNVLPELITTIRALLAELQQAEAAVNKMEDELQTERGRNDEMGEQLGYAAEDGWTDETEKL